MKYFLVIAFYSGLVALVNAQCANDIAPIQGDPERFSGLHQSVSHTKLDDEPRHACRTFELKQTEDMKPWSEEFIAELTELIDGELVVTDLPIKPVKDNIFETNVDFKGTNVRYTLIDTDYDNFATLLACTDNGNTNNGEIYTRSGTIDPALLAEQQEKLAKYGVDRDAFVDTDRSNC